MQYPRMGQTRQYRVTVPELNGGINYAVPPHLIDDNQLSDAVNVWYQNGALKTRPGLLGVDYSQRFADIQYRYGSVGKTGYIVRENVIKGSNFVTLIREDGTMQTGTYTVPDSDDESASVMWASVNGQVKGLSSEDALVYINGSACGVYGMTTDKTLEKLEPYTPTILLNGRPVDSPAHDANGDQFEPYNMLHDECVLKYTPDGNGEYYRLPFTDADIISVEYCGQFANGNFPVDLSNGAPTHKSFKEQDGVFYETAALVDGYAVVYNQAQGCFWFVTPDAQGYVSPNGVPSVLAESHVANVITVRIKRNDEVFKRSRNTILGMKFSTWYGGGSAGLTGGTRLFVGGNPDHPNLVHWSALNNPLYFPDSNSAYVGEDTGAVTAFGRQNDMLVIFKENALFYTTYVQGNAVTAEQIESQEVTDIEAAAAMFPMMQIHPEVGCDCPNTIQLCNNRLVWLNSDGNVYGLFSSGVYNERNLRRLSLQLGDRLRQLGADTLKSASATRYGEQYLLLVGKQTVYAMDFSSYGFNYYGSYSTDEKAQKAVVWYRWEFPWKLEALIRVRETAVAIGDGFRTFLLDDTTAVDTYADEGGANEKIIQSSFCTKLFDFGHSERFKRVNSLYLQITGKIGEKAFLTYHNGKDKHSNADAVVFFETEPEATAPQLIRPNAIRTRLFGFEVSSDCRIEVGDLIINYSTMGAIR